MVRVCLVGLKVWHGHGQLCLWRGHRCRTSMAWSCHLQGLCSLVCLGCWSLVCKRSLGSNQCGWRCHLQGVCSCSWVCLLACWSCLVCESGELAWSCALPGLCSCSLVRLRCWSCLVWQGSLGSNRCGGCLYSWSLVCLGCWTCLVWQGSLGSNRLAWSCLCSWSLVCLGCWSSLVWEGSFASNRLAWNGGLRGLCSLACLCGRRSTRCITCLDLPAMKPLNFLVVGLLLDVGKF